MKLFKVLLINFLLLTGADAFSQKNSYTPQIETCDCAFKVDPQMIKSAPAKLQSALAQPFDRIDSSFKTQCGYLIVPENRNKRKSNLIKLPFIILKSKNPDKQKDPLLFTSGGPGNSSLSWIAGMTRGEFIKDRDCIAIEQRGTRYAIPYLRNLVLDSLMRIAYRNNLSKDSMFLEGIKVYRKILLKRGVDLDGYNSEESISDIHDLLSTLKIDSVNLLGGSYSGGLMMGVLQKDPSRIRSLVLDSPLPMFSPIDEDEPAHFIEALNILFRHVEQDSVGLSRYANLKAHFQTYFTSIAEKVFYQNYLEKGTPDSVQIAYTKNELLNEIIGILSSDKDRKNLAFVVTEMMSGNHQAYIQHQFDQIFNKNPSPDGMRISVYCADQANYHDQAVVKQLYALYPFMEGYHINDVYKTVCDCWKVKALNPVLKQHFYSDKPVWIGDGEMDPACSPRYMAEIHHYMPNAQPFLFLNRAHGVGGKHMTNMVGKFLNQPYQQLRSPDASIVAF